MPADKPAVVTAKHVRQAQKQVKGAVDKQRAPKMSEFCDLVETWDGPALKEKLASRPGQKVHPDAGRVRAGEAQGRRADKKLLSAYEDVVFPEEAVSRPVKQAGKSASKSSMVRPLSRRPVTKPSPKTAVKKAAKAPARLGQGGSQESGEVQTVVRC